MGNKLLSVVLTGDSSNLSSTLTRAAGQVKTFESQVEGSNSRILSSSKLMAVGVAAAAVGIAAGLAFAVTSAIGFETQMRNVNSISKMSEEQLRATGDAVISLSTRVPQSAESLAEGLYDIASSGFQGAEGLAVLEASAIAASAGMSDTATASRAITAVLNAYGLQASEAADVSDILFQAVNVGVVSFEELASTVGDVVGTAAAASVAIDEVSAAIATMTLSGISASEAGTSLNRLIQSLIDPSDELATALRDVGYASGLQALQTDDLNVVLEKLRQRSEGNIETLLKWFPEIRAARGALALMANEGRNMADTFGAITDEEARAGAAQDAFNEQMKATSAQLRLFGNQITAVAIQVGTNLLPVVQDIISALGSLGRVAIPLVASAIEALRPFWTSIVEVGKDLISILQTAAEYLEPVARLMAGLIVGGVITFLNGVGEALSAVTGFLAEHEGIVQAVATAYASYLAVQAAGHVAQWVSSLGSALGTAASFLRNHLSDISEFVGQAGGSFRALGSVLSNPYFLGAAAVFGTLTAVIYSHNRRAEEAKQRAQEFTAAMEEQTGTIRENVNALLARKFADDDLISGAHEAGLSFETMADAVQGSTAQFDRAEDSLRGMYGQIANMDVNVDQMARAMEDAGLTGTEFADQMLALADNSDLTGIQILDLITKIQRLNGDHARGAEQARVNAEAEEALGVAVEETEPEVDAFTQALQQMTAAQEQATEATKAYGDTIRAQFDPLFGMVDAVNGVRDAQLNYADAVADVTVAQAELDAAVRDYGPTSAEAADAQRKLEDALRGVEDAEIEAASAAMDLDVAARDLATGVLTGQTSLDQARGALARWVAQGSLTEGQAAEVAAQFERILSDADRMHGRNVEMSVTHTTRYHVMVTGAVGPNTPPIPSRGAYRHGGIVHAFAEGGVADYAFARSGITPAHIQRGQTIKYAEPETGGEAYIPRLGDRRRSLSILEHAAGWYGARVIPMAAGGVHNGPSSLATTTYSSVLNVDPGAVMVTVNASAGADAMQLERVVKRAVEPAVQAFSERLTRELRMRRN